MKKDRIVFNLALMSLALVLAPARAVEKTKPQPESVPGSVYINSIGMRLAHIPAGAFQMGSPGEEKGRQDDERPHQVKITHAYRLGATEVTQGQWTQIMGARRGHFTEGGENLPVEKVSSKDAAAFCAKLSEKETAASGKTILYRLPTEAEWEYACRAGAKEAFAGTGNLDEMGWHEANSEEHTHPVATKKPNAWGLYDMHGNVSEWCSDRYGAEFDDENNVDPTGPEEGRYRVIRGGSWAYFARSARCAARMSSPGAYQTNRTGFRVVMEIEPDPSK